jgi:hypothetical protein
MAMSNDETEVENPDAMAMSSTGLTVPTHALDVSREVMWDPRILS